MKKSKPKSAEEAEEIIPAKIKSREFDLEGHEIFSADKIEEPEALEEGEETDELAEGVELDDEEINPFKDKWEE